MSVYEKIIKNYFTTGLCVYKKEIKKKTNNNFYFLFDGFILKKFTITK